MAGSLFLESSVKLSGALSSAGMEIPLYHAPCFLSSMNISAYVIISETLNMPITKQRQNIASVLHLLILYFAVSLNELHNKVGIPHNFRHLATNRRLGTEINLNA